MDVLGGGFMPVLTLSSGFSFDYSNLVGQSFVKETDIAALQEKIVKAHQAISHMRQTGEVLGHLSKDGLPEKVLFTQLPYIQEDKLNSPQLIAKLKAFGESLRFNTDAVISFGIGGSYLGNKVIFDTYAGEFWNFKSQTERKGYPKLYFSGNNLDPRRMKELMEQLLRDAKHKQKHRGTNYKVTLIVISKSGSTLETMTKFMLAFETLTKDPLIDFDIVAVTDPREDEGETLLKGLAKAKGWTTFSVPDGVGGRFSVFSEVGLITAACIGFDIEAFLEGARHMDEACQSSEVQSNPALLNATLKFIAAQKYGRNIEVFMPYGDYLKSVAEWYIQLLAESLGKRYDRDGREIYYGRTPIVALGTTDMHAQTQQHQDGIPNKVIQFVEVRQWREDQTIPDVFPETKKLQEFAGLTLATGLKAALEANAMALTKDQRYNATFVIPELNPYYLGQLLYLLALSVAYEGELSNVNAYDQPGVEAYKKILGPRLKELKTK